MTREEKQKAIDALKISVPFMTVTQEEFNDYIQTRNQVMDWLEQDPCEDAISRQAAIDLCDKRTRYDIPYEYYEGKIYIRGWDEGRIINMTKLKLLPSVTTIPSAEPKTGHRKYISVDTVVEWLKEEDIIKMSWQEDNARKELEKLEGAAII